MPTFLVCHVLHLGQSEGRGGRRPAQVALAAADAAAWPLLAVAAAAYGRTPALQCLAAYLRATLARLAPDAQARATSLALHGIMESWGADAASLVR